MEIDDALLVLLSSIWSSDIFRTDFQKTKTEPTQNIEKVKGVAEAENKVI